jgi:DNA-binding MurR/RpiR family transcriptional regulator
MFSTQLSGLFKRLHEKEEEAIEDSSRLLAQAIVSDGKVYFYATKEMAGVIAEATKGMEPMPNAVEWTSSSLDTITSNDRFILFSRTNEEEEINTFAKNLYNAQVSFISVCSITNKEIESLVDFADVSIDLKLSKGLLPDDVGNRYGYPSLIAALFIYHGIKFTTDEILKEYDI